LEKLWFSISSYFLKLNGIKEVINAIRNFWEIKKDIDFEIDWLVLKVNDISLWKKIWFTEHHPRYAISYKFPAEVFTTTILSVDHQVGRTWTITPVANLNPVNMWWAIIRRATLHNYEEVENLDVKIWDTVFIKRAGEVIPKIISVVQTWNRDNLKKIEIPKYCPSCEAKVLKDEWKVRYYCSNTVDCPAKHHEKLTFAVGKWWFNIDWFWVKQVETFLNEWIINNLVDIFKISEKKQDILSLEWFREKSVANLIQWVEKAKNVDISTFLTALWIAWVWKKTAKTLSKLFKSETDLLNFSFDEQFIEKLDDIWPEIAKNVVEYFETESHRRILKELLKILNIKYYKEINISKQSLFTWKSMCITWSFEKDWKKISRDELIQKLEDVWWNFVWSVSKNLDYLLAWEKAWSKLEKANKLWIEVINLTYFLKSL
jgi:DNA ligase (NAD+)